MIILTGIEISRVLKRMVDYCAWRVKFSIGRRSVNKKIESLRHSHHQALESTFVDEVNNALRSQGQFVDAYWVGSCDIGGANNICMLVHVDKKTYKPSLITKIALWKDIQRECRFMQWHEQQGFGQKEFCSSLIVSGRISSEDLGFFTTDYLGNNKYYSNESVCDLWCKMNFDIERLSCISEAEIVDGYASLPLVPDTKIKSILNDIVTRLHMVDGFDAAISYLKDRKSFFRNSESEYLSLVKTFHDVKVACLSFDLRKHFGFVHGDFKRQNILCAENGQLKLIDWQYYCVGVRLWDLAFYMSKDNTAYVDFYNDLVGYLGLNREQEVLFLYLYIIAALLHVDHKKISQVMERQVSPALKYLKLNLGG